MLYDILKSVNGNAVTGWPMEEILRRLVGPEGTPVTLGFTRTFKSDERTSEEVAVHVNLTRSIRALPRDHVPGTVSMTVCYFFLFASIFVLTSDFN